MTDHPLNTHAAARVHYVDPRVRQLAEARWRLITGGTRMDWLCLGKDNPEALIREGRDWIRAAVATGLLPLVEPSTGEAIAPAAEAQQPAPALPRRFHLQRDTDITGVSGTGRVADGVLWPDGSVALRWRGDRPSTVHWDRIADAEHVHGHGGATRIVWDDQAVHVGGNAEDCPACAGTNPDYPFICPGPGADEEPRP